MTSVDLYAQTRIRFARGRSSATVRGTLPAKSDKVFVVRASAGQTIRMSGNNRRLDFSHREVPKGNYGSSELEANNGDNEFVLSNMTNRAISYTMTVSIR